MDTYRTLMKWICRATLMLTGCLLCAGCGTILGRDYPSLRPVPTLTYYPATQYDLVTVFMGGTVAIFGNDGSNDLPSRPRGFVMVPLGLIDLPISLVTDTVLLPVDFMRDRSEDSPTPHPEGKERIQQGGGHVR